jgi:CTP:phosphocholine cytidylyltransferase-like protein/thiamine kinase-like enzyme
VLYLHLYKIVSFPVHNSEKEGTVMDRTAYLLREYLENPRVTQRVISEKMDISLGSVNSLIADAAGRGLLNKETKALTAAGKVYLKPYKVDGAVILAAGFGSRFVPLTYETPKGLLEVFGERMVERQIKQLHEAGITDITIVVGYLKEKFDYLIDLYGVKLLYNPEYDSRNNLASVLLAQNLFKGRNSYLLCSDHWMRNNMFHAYEPGAWYSSVYRKEENREWALTFNKKDIITDIQIGAKDSWVMYGPAYFSREFSSVYFPAAEKAYRAPGTEQIYWENILLNLLRDKKDPADPNAEMAVNKQPADQVYEFENLEELRKFDTRYNTQSDNLALQLIAKTFEVPESEIRELKCLKSGMTNKSFLFSVKGKHYICRIPGNGTSELIDRRAEYDNYMAVAELDIAEHVIYFNPENGYKISEFYDGSRNSDPRNFDDVARCMKLLKSMHESGATVGHRFDIRERISFYETLCNRNGGIPFEDYLKIRSEMNELMDFLDSLNRPEKLSHVDSVATNFIFVPSKIKGGKETVRLIDWEYAGMADPLIDIGMCAIYSYYTPEETEQLMNLYFGRTPSREERLVVYSYMALGGFLWTLWAVYKGNLGETFGDYTLVMYRYAKDYYRKVKNI